MDHWRLKCAILAALVSASFGIVWIAGGPAAAGELTPYNLPSQQRQQAVPDMRQQVAPRPVRPSVDQSYYQRFAAEARTYSPAQRSELQASFTRSRDQALRAGQVDEAQHYSRLLDILGALH